MTEPPIPTSPSTPSVPKEPPSAPPPPSPLDRAFLTGQPDVTQLVLVRHGKQEWPSHPNPTPADFIDPPLSELGRRQAEVAGQALAGERIDFVYCSHLHRAHETAMAVAARHALEPVVLQELREVEMYRDLPEGTALRTSVNETVWLGIQERFVQERRWDVFPYTETSAEFRSRIVTVVEGLLATHPGANLAVVCHGGVINAYVGHILGLTEDMFFRPGHASVSRVLANASRRVVRTLNETHHLDAADPALVTF